MFSFRRSVVILAFLSLVSLGASAFGQDSSSTQPAPDQIQPQAPAATQSQSGQVSVQSRIKARREARRAQTIRDTYRRTYELFIGAGYQRFNPGPPLQWQT